MLFDVISYILAKKKASWNEVKQKLQTEGALNIAYDSDLQQIIDYNKLQLFGIRKEVLKEFTSPKVLLITSSMNLALVSADIVEAAAGNISATSQELTIIGGTSTSSGHSWVYWDLPEPATKVYVKVSMNSVDAANTTIDLGASSFSATPYDAVDQYRIFLAIGNAAADFRTSKVVAGTSTILTTESVDLNYNTYYLVETLFVGDGAGNNRIKVWRDGILKFDFTDTETAISSIQSIRFLTYDSSTTAAQSSKFKGDPLVIIYE